MAKVSVAAETDLLTDGKFAIENQIESLIQRVAGRQVAWEPQPRQELMLMCPADETFFGGAKGGGKTDGALGAVLKQLRLARDFNSTARMVFFRRSYNELDEVIQRTHEIFPALGGQWKAGEKTWVFHGYGRLKMRFLEKDIDVMRYQGHSYDLILMDELGNYATAFCYNHMLSCLRSPMGVPSRMIGTGNPGGPGQRWIKKRFIAGKIPDHIHLYTQKALLPNGKVYELKTTRCFIPSNVMDNRYWMENDPRYIARLAALPEHLRRAFLNGDWDVSIGQAFGEICDDHKCKPFLIPQDWIRFASLDWGFVKPYSLGLWALSPRGRLYRIGEDYGCVEGLEDEGVKLSVHKAARRFIKILTSMGIDRVHADPELWKRTGYPKTRAKLFEEEGLPLIPANRDRLTSKQAFHDMLQNYLEDGLPQIQIFDHCSDWWRTVPTLMSDKNNIEDVDTKSEDHVYDDTRYAIMSREVAEGLQIEEVAQGSSVRSYHRPGGKYARRDR